MFWGKPHSGLWPLYKKAKLGVGCACVCRIKENMFKVIICVAVFNGRQFDKFCKMVVRIVSLQDEMRSLS